MYNHFLIIFIGKHIITQVQLKKKQYAKEILTLQMKRVLSSERNFKKNVSDIQILMVMDFIGNKKFRNTSEKGRTVKKNQRP